MKTIKNPFYAKFRGPEFLQLMTSVLDVYKKHQSSSTTLSTRIDTFENAIKSMRQVLNESKGETAISELSPMDKKRIKAVRGLRWFLQSEVYRERPERLKHAEVLLKNFNQHCDDIGKASFQHKTICIDKMLEEWKTEPMYIDAVKAIQAESWVEDLAQHNAVFYEKYMDKAESTDRELKTIERRAMIKVAFEDLTTDTFALARVAPDKEVYEALVKSLNNVINMNNDTVSRRRSRRKKEEPPVSFLPVPA